MSTPPNLSTAALTILSQFSSELGRSTTTSVLPPSFSHSAATCLSVAALLAASTTLAPAPASVLAERAPNAPDAPATMAVLPLMSNSESGFFRKSSDMAFSSLFFFTSPRVRGEGEASLRRHRHRNHDGADLVAAVDDLACLVRLDNAGVVCLQHGFLAVDDHGQFAAQHEVDFLGRRGVRPRAAAGQEVRVAEHEALGAAGLGAEHAQ